MIVGDALLLDRVANSQQTPPHESNKRRLKRLLSQMDWNDFSTPQKGYNPTLARRRIIE